MTTWREWVDSQSDAEMRRRREIIVQVISAGTLTYSWQSYEKSVETMDGAPFAMPPDRMREVIIETAAKCKTMEWSRARIRDAF